MGLKSLVVVVVMFIDIKKLIFTCFQKLYVFIILTVSCISGPGQARGQASFCPCEGGLSTMNTS
jgi:hypothetical protein